MLLVLSHRLHPEGVDFKMTLNRLVTRLKKVKCDQLFFLFGLPCDRCQGFLSSWERGESRGSPCGCVCDELAASHALVDRNSDLSRERGWSKLRISLFLLILLYQA